MSIGALEPYYQQIPNWETSEKAEPEDKTGMNQFLTLLVAQLKNQDPLNPKPMFHVKHSKTRCFT